MMILRLLLIALTAITVKPDAFHTGFPPPPIHGGFHPGGRSFSSAGPRSDNSHCALLIPGPGKSSSRDHAIGVFNGIQSPATEGYTCISFQSVNAAFKAARDKHGLPRPGKNPVPEDQASLATVLLETTRNLAQEYNLPKDVLINGFPLVDSFKTIVGAICPDFIPPTTCQVTKYRSYDGKCNNLDNPIWGSKNVAFKRRLPPDYADGIDAPRVGRGGYPLPSPRVVSAHLHRDEGLHDHAVTIMAVAWGQAIDHDFTFTVETKDKITKQEPKCCERDRHHPSCFPIPVPDKDPFYSLFRQNCINLVRSLPGIRYGCKLGPRSQINSVTSYMDGNWIYGSDEETASRIRLRRGGLLKSLPVFREYGMKDLLPLKLEEPEEGCIRPNNDVYCFDAGDGRVNEQLVLAVIHTLMMREHNRLATELYKINPHWDDEILFQEARHIVAAQVQHISFNEFLPMILGKDVMTKYGIILEKHGYFDGYDPKIDVTMSANFVTSAFRFGHSLLPSTIERWSPGNKYIASQRLSHMLRQPYDLYKGGWCDQYIMGLTNQVAQAMDDAVTQEVTNHLFQDPDKRWGMDLAAINMQRGREHGVPSYNDFRDFCGLPRAHKFDDLLGSMSNKTVRRYADIYRHPDDIDLWSGGVSERPLPGSMVGPTFSCLIGLTFKELRYGDRYWYENRGYPSSFSPEQLEEVRKTKLSRIICDNSDDIKVMQVYAMVLPDHEINPRVPCNSGILPRMDLSKWRDPHGPHPRPQAGPIPIVELNPLILPEKTKSHFQSPSGGSFSSDNIPKNISPKPSGPKVPTPFNHPKPHATTITIDGPTTAISISDPSPHPHFGPLKPSSEIHIIETPHPSPSYGVPHPPPPPPPLPQPHPEAFNPPPHIPEPFHPLSPSYSGPGPFPAEFHEPIDVVHLHVHHSGPVGPRPSYGPPPPGIHGDFDAPVEYCQGHFKPLSTSYGPPPVRQRNKNPFRQFLGHLGFKG
ncbi:peroxidase-like [Palaemon carinicauda]|uniref:peroxidase-like n=1 Tax=Palaemon carinicauda TaxID=392227 RepID=UPI0035B645FD